MKKIFTVLGLTLLVGCGTGISNDPIKVPTECPECPEPQACPAPGETIFAGFEDFTDRIDLNNIKLNHYVDGEQFEENFADVATIDGKIMTKNAVTLPDFNGQTIKHIIVVEFYQIK